MPRKLGLDRPLHEQYVDYLRAVATGDFGPTFTFPSRTVNGILAAGVP